MREAFGTKSVTLLERSRSAGGTVGGQSAHWAPVAVSGRPPSGGPDEPAMLVSASESLWLALRGQQMSRPWQPRRLRCPYTIAEAAKIISDVRGQAINYTDIDRDEWVAAAVAGGVPAEYGAVLRMLTETIASRHGSQPSSDVEKATGAAPPSFADFARRTAAAWDMDETP